MTKKKDEFQEYLERQLMKNIEESLPVGSWVAHKKGGPGESSFEISVIRKGYGLGFESFGWFEKDKKLLVTHNGGPCTWPLTTEIWDACWKVAQAEANRLNEIENVNIPSWMRVGALVECLNPIGHQQGYEMWDTWTIVMVVPQYQTCLLEDNNGNRGIRSWKYMRQIGKG